MTHRFLNLGFASALLLVAGGCALGEPIEGDGPYRMSDGPGLLSGEDGEFILYRR